MIGIEIRAVGKRKSSLVKILKEAITEIENRSTRMYIPLNDEDNTQCNLTVCDIEDKDLDANWDDTRVLTYEQWDEDNQ